MIEPIDQAVYRLLRAQQMPVARSYLQQQLFSHPEPNSLLSITDTLDELGITYTAVRIEKDQLPELDRPFLAHITRDNGQFVLVDKQTDDDWARTWTGVVLVLEESQKTNNAENTRTIAVERRNKGLMITAIALILAVLAYPQIGHFSWTGSLLTASSILGLAVSILIFQKEAGLNNPIIEQLCQTEKTTDCNTVLESKASNLLGWVKLSDMGITYFSGQLAILHLSGIGETSGRVYAILSWLAICGATLTFLSLYYQGVVLKKWCTLCLSVVAVLWLQFFILFSSISFYVQPLAALGLLAAFILTGVLWLLLKQTLQANISLCQQLYRSWRLKRDPAIFAHLIKDQPRVDDSPFEEELQLGAANSPIRLLAVFNPYCKPCAAEYQHLEELLSSAPETFQLVVRFTLKATGRDKRAEAVRYLLQYWRTHAPHLSPAKSPLFLRRLLRDWFAVMNLPAFMASHPLAGSQGATLAAGPEVADLAADAASPFPDVSDLLTLHDNWSTANAINATPTLFLNGLQLPRQYSPRDLLLLKSTLTDFAKVIGSAF